MEILVECDTNGVLDLVDGILPNYKLATKMLDDETYISTYNQNGISNLQSMLESTGNRNVRLKDGGLFLFDKSIWCRQSTTAQVDERYLNVISRNFYRNNIISNGRDIKNIRNALISNEIL
ncbi:unnamed protein product [Chironomus riparius]|uniref:Uncharacterized protein n=1 Tax=Chironomus riparius TaxID=315576 RepID=A0A9N9RXH8_9DIPT|nr:unnamed protein product [Chironomus riparius]